MHRHSLWQQRPYFRTIGHHCGSHEVADDRYGMEVGKLSAEVVMPSSSKSVSCVRNV